VQQKRYTTKRFFNIDSRQNQIARNLLENVMVLYNSCCASPPTRLPLCRMRVHAPILPIRDARGIGRVLRRPHHTRGSVVNGPLGMPRQSVIVIGFFLSSLCETANRADLPFALTAARVTSVTFATAGPEIRCSLRG